MEFFSGTVLLSTHLFLGTKYSLPEFRFGLESLFRETIVADKVVDFVWPICSGSEGKNEVTKQIWGCKDRFPCQNVLLQFLT